MTLLEALLDSWDRQCRIVHNVAALISEENRSLRPSPESWPLDHQLAHVHLVRLFFLRNIAPDEAAGIESSFIRDWEEPISDLGKIKELLSQSDIAVRKAVERALREDIAKIGWYDNAVLYLQHMVWHEGWHVGQIMLALRLAGQEPPESWEEPNIWGLWRTEEY